MLALFMGLGLWWRVGILVAFVVMVGGAVWGVYHSIYKRGYDAAELVYKPKLIKAETDLKNAIHDIETAQAINKEFQAELARLDAVTHEQQRSIDQYKAEALAAEIKVRKALVEIAVKEKKYTAEIARLVAIAAGPPITEGAYEEADAILRALIRDRMRNPGPTASAGDAATQGGTGGGGGHETVH